MKNKKQLFIYAAILIAGISIGWMIFGGGKENPSQSISSDKSTERQKEIWTCSMHPQIRKDRPGKCPICGMDLIPVNNGSDNQDTVWNKIQMSESAMKIAEVQTTIIQKSSPGKEIRLPGKVKSDERKIAVITSRFAGRIEKLFVNFTGQNVQQGEKLATVYSPDLITAQKELFEAIKFKQSNPEYYKAARNKLKLWSLSENQIDNIEKNGESQNYFDVLSPLGGTVTKRDVALGDYVNEGALLFEISDLSSVWILFDAYESDLPWIRTGDNVSFEVQSMPGKMFNGKVTFIDPLMDSETRVAYVRTEIVNPGNLLKPEMFVRGIIKTKLSSSENALLIPKSSVLWTGKKAIVYVKVKEQTKPTFEYREITLGEDAGSFYVVKDGLKEGEEIVTNGVFKVDAAAQLAGKQSMMNPKSDGGKKSMEPNHEEMKMDARDKKSNSKTSMTNENSTTFSFKVFGNCEMCQARIEKAALSLKGILSADWNKETKIINVVSENKLLKPVEVSDAITAIGHDTEYKTATEESYNNLPDCCRYERKTDEM
ncbi:MAG: efflux RND transporter periplasmic adaptor subunit [Bacteroidetes bacterium]|nr:efflux RND transporter periplasmic adaptor subunit [Bacteroidota bacterium]